jgi:hypothetical protein
MRIFHQRQHDKKENLSFGRVSSIEGANLKHPKTRFQISLSSRV